MNGDDQENPVLVYVERDLLIRVLELAKNVAQDLIAFVDAQNAGDHPVSVRRRDRDKADARDLLNVVLAVQNQTSRASA